MIGVSDLSQIPSGILHKLPYVFSDGFARDILQYSPDTLEIVFLAFAVSGFPGIRVDKEGYLLCAVVSMKQLGLFYSVDKSYRGLRLLGLRTIKFGINNPPTLEGAVDDLVSEAKSVGAPTAGAGLVLAMRHLMRDQAGSHPAT